MKRYWRKFKNWWLPIAEAIGNFMNRVILSAFYFIAVLPFGIGVRIFSDPLSLKCKDRTEWQPLPRQRAGVDDARKQY